MTISPVGLRSFATGSAMPDDPRPPLDTARRAQLRQALVARAAWIDADEVGPRAVDAGACDQCGQLPRLIPTCGPESLGALCRTCALNSGVDAWCAGHEDQALQALAWAQRLPEDWATTTVAWWIATGEVRDTGEVRGTGERLDVPGAG